MRDVTDRFLTSLTGPHRYATIATCTVPGGSPVTLTVRRGGGSLSVDYNALVRRRVSDLSIVGDSTVFEMVATPGATFDIAHGVKYGASSELLPIIHGEASQPRQSFGSGIIDLTILDRGQWLSRTRFLAPYTVAAGTGRVAAILACVSASIPGVVTSNLSSDTGILATAQVWQDGPGGLISDLTKDGNTEAFFGPDGTFIIRDLPTIYSTPNWYVNSGDGGVLIEAARTRPMDRLYNTVVVRPNSFDGSQTWTQQVAQVTDPTHPRHPSKIGVVPYFFASPTIATGTAGMITAQTILTRLLGTTDTLSISAISNPALDGNDVLRVTTPQMNREPGTSFQHYVSDFSLNLDSGDMSINTRSQVVTDD